jgi:hypothetical protein
VINTHNFTEELFEKKKFENEIPTEYLIFVDRQVYILPLNKKSISDSDIFLINMGSIKISNDIKETNADCFNIYINDINFEYADNMSDWLTKLESNQENNDNYEILGKITLNMRLISLYSDRVFQMKHISDSSNIYIETKLSPIVFNSNKRIFEKLLRIGDIFR